MSIFKSLRLIPAALVTLTLALAAIPNCTSSVAYAEGLTAAPPNPQFVHFMQGAYAPHLKSLQASDRECTLGLIPPPVDLSRTTGVRTFSVYQTQSLPTSYDLRTLGKLSPVGDQGASGCCWAFATMGSLESSLLPGEVWDFSENNLKNEHGFDLVPDGGGNHFMSTAYLARWAGPVAELDDPYNQYSGSSPSGLPIRKHVQQVLFIPNRASRLDNANLKQAVISSGAVYTTMYWDPGSYDPSTSAYYYEGTYTSNHSVCIVGWDDRFDRRNFADTPPGDGAFLVKNSWGTGFGDSGFFHVSYYDSSIGLNNAAFVKPESTSNYKHIYQYDPMGWIESMGYGNSTAWLANVFTSASAEQLQAVSFYATTPNTAYSIYVYRDPSAGPLSSSGLAATKSGLSPLGYSTVRLDQPVALAPGERYSVVLKLTCTGDIFPIAAECPISGYSSAATAGKGESYVSADGVSWSDMTATYPNTNVCVKAFSSDDSRPSDVSLTPNSGRLATGTKLSFVSKYNDPDGCKDIAFQYLLINTTNSATKSVYVKYDSVTNKLYVRDDADTTWLGGFAPGSGSTIQNSECILYCRETTLSGSGTASTISWKLLIKPTMAGKTCGVWMTVIDRAGLRASWDKMGSFTVK